MRLIENKLGEIFNMKKVIKLFCLSSLLFCLTSNAQVFTLLSGDTQGDNTQLLNDIKTISYALDFASDDIWLKVEFFDTIKSDFGFAFGLDTNLITTDGSSWQGSNSSMKYDRIIFLNRNGFFQQNITSSSPAVKSIDEVDSVTLVVNFQLSLLDSDGNFNLIAGSGGFDIASGNEVTFDDVPNNSFTTVPLTVSIRENLSEEFTIYPNPTSDYLNVKLKPNSEKREGHYNVLSIDGKRMLRVSAKQDRLDVSKLKKGEYLLVLENDSGVNLMSKFHIK